MEPDAPSRSTIERASQLLHLDWDLATNSLQVAVSGWVLLALGVLALFGIIWRLRWEGRSFRDFEIDQAELGIGTGKVRFRPNWTDRQVAYAIWVEVSTRKIGLPIDFEHDVIVEVYDSWYAFFSVTRELIKSVPASKVRTKGTQAIIDISVELLNEGLRPHLTRWQARFRRWYEREAERRGSDGSVGGDADPQQIQSEFPKFSELQADMRKVNDALIRYREKMRELVWDG